MLPSYPIQEDDSYRYLWDGAVTAHLCNPYTYSPSEIRQGLNSSGEVPEKLKELAETSWATEYGGRVIDRINHRDLRTLYPPVAQLFFGLSHLIRPWSLVGWRILLIAVDFVVLLLILRLMARFQLPRSTLAIYWWNPILIKEIFNSGHMDLIVLPFVLGAYLFLEKGKPRRATGLLSLAVGCKLWPVMLLPFFIKRMNSTLIRFQSLILATFVMGIILIPYFIFGLGPGSGFFSYGMNWEVNGAFFKVIKGIASACFLLLGDGGDLVSIGVVSRGTVFVLLVAWMVFLLRSPLGGERDFWQRGLAVVAAIFLLSPTGYPWYFTWLLPFIIVRQYAFLMALNIVLPMYYLRFYSLYHGMPEIYEGVIVWVEFVPVWLLLAFERWQNWKECRKNQLTGQSSLP